jgi:hypothetical protein
VRLLPSQRGSDLRTRTSGAHDCYRTRSVIVDGQATALNLPLALLAGGALLLNAYLGQAHRVTASTRNRSRVDRFPPKCSLSGKAPPLATPEQTFVAEAKAG